MAIPGFGMSKKVNLAKISALIKNTYIHIFCQWKVASTNYLSQNNLECHDVLKQNSCSWSLNFSIGTPTCSHGRILTVMWLWMSWLQPNMSTNLYTAASLHLRWRSARVYLDAFTPLRSSMGKTGCAGTVTCKEPVPCPCLLAVASTTFSCSLCIALLGLGGRLDPSIWLFMMPSNSLRKAPLFRILVTLCSRSSTLKSRCKT